MNDWQKRAACKGLTELFFLGRGESCGAVKHPARTVCADCPVNAECLEWSLKMGPTVTRYGIWAGLNGHELIALRRQRKTVIVT